MHNERAVVALFIVHTLTGGKTWNSLL